ncbi:hypothetical protein [Parasutterella muris]|uniref:hypothetical protein n=1 Tax=Parasutterella muris TaxID=2565572 RepID=UPI00203A8C19|nr:hypothetical protein [Parasutterella muris]
MLNRSLIFAAIAAVLVSGCRTIPEIPSQMTCDDLDYLAEQAMKSSRLPFFTTQVKYPGDWRPYAPNRWIQEGSRKQVRELRKDYLQMEILEVGDNINDQTPYRVRVLVNTCRDASKKPQGELLLINYLKDAPGKFSQKVPFSFTGQEPQDYLGRLVCGYQKLPDVDREQEMAQRWLQCRQPKN